VLKPAVKRTLVHFHYYDDVTYPTSHSLKSYGRVATGENSVSQLFSETRGILYQQVVIVLRWKFLNFKPSFTTGLGDPKAVS